jgi:hypothetical protein
MLIFGFISVFSLNQTTSTLGYLVRFIPVGIGIGLFQSPNNSAVMGSAPRERLGVASGLLSLTRTIGQTAGIALLGAFWESRVVALSGGVLTTDVTEAPFGIQIAGLHNTIVLVIFILIVALSFSVWALVQFYKAKKTAPIPTVE